MFRQAVGGAVLVGLAVAATGCQKSGPPRAFVTGTVSYQGKTLTTGEVAFYPESAPTEQPCLALIGRDGTYRMTEILLGKYTVSVVAPAKPLPGQTPRTPPPNRPIPVYIPVKFAKPQSSGLSFEVRDGTQQFDIPLAD
ncbi:hypothetical protein [Fimbriiglobus ruber]|nr:hypothetical protein [Fimbriiglobus ruber]